MRLAVLEEANNKSVAEHGPLRVSPSGRFNLLLFSSITQASVVVPLHGHLRREAGLAVARATKHLHMSLPWQPLQPDPGQGGAWAEPRVCLVPTPGPPLRGPHEGRAAETGTCISGTCACPGRSHAAQLTSRGPATPTKRWDPRASDRRGSETQSRSDLFWTEQSELVCLAHLLHATHCGLRSSCHLLPVWERQ